MKRFLMAVFLMAIVSSYAFAGDIPTADYVPPPPPPPQSSTSAQGTSPGDIPTVDSAATLEVVQTILVNLARLMAR